MTQHHQEHAKDGVGARSKRASRGSTSTRQRASNQGKDRPDLETSKLPPRKKKNDNLTLKHYRLRSLDVLQTEAVVRQRHTDQNDIVRKQYERGVLTDSALGAPGEDGLYGLYQGRRLAELLRSDINGLLSFALTQGVVPALIQEYRTIIASLNETIQGLRVQSVSGSSSAMPPEVTPQPNLTAATDVSDEAASIIDMFFSDEESNQK